MENASQAIKNKPQTRQGLIRIAAALLSLYALIEAVDCVTAILMAFELTGNPYPAMLFKEVQSLFDTQPAWLVPLFLFYTSLRATAAIGLWRNRMWGFWTAIFVTIATLIMAPFLLPFTAAEMLGNGILIILLLIGFFGDAPIKT